MNKKIAILTHAMQKFEPTPYLLHTFIDLWKKMGIDVVILRGIEHFEPADALFMHVDLTVTPGNYLSFSKMYPVVINGKISDISKRKISSNLLTIPDIYHDKVLVKTDLNCGGGMERRLSRRRPLTRLMNRIKKRLPWYLNGYLPPENYPIFDCPMHVPSAVWWNKHLVVEKFLPEREGNHYCLRQWVFMGDREMSQRTVSSQPIVKACNILHREEDIPIPDALRNVRAAMGFDYGKFDFVMIDGEAILLDANRTPSFNASNASPARMTILGELSRGMLSLLNGPHSAQSFESPEKRKTTL